jgi:membrane-associated phospholipid phosphatase
MEFLYLLEKIRNPILDTFFSLVTHLGEETVFLALAIIFFWCVSKYEGYYIMITGLVGTLVNQALKLAFRIPRPWVLDPDFTVVESARPEATGYSFPSGHTQNIAGTFGAIGASSRKRWVSITALVIIILVAFSRMYLGVHTPKDVCVSLLIAAGLLAILYPVFSSEERFHRFMPIVAAVSVALSIGLTLFAFLVPEEGIDPANLYSARKNAATLLGCTVCLFPVYYIDKYYTKFDTSAPWYAQIIKIAVGLGVVLAIKSGLSAPLVLLFGNEFVARGVRYFLIVAFAGILWPMTFKFFAKMRIPALDNLFKKKDKT